MVLRDLDQHGPLRGGPNMGCAKRRPALLAAHHGVEMARFVRANAICGAGNSALPKKKRAARRRDR